jgi:hypothetical protein
VGGGMLVWKRTALRYAGNVQRGCGGVWEGSLLRPIHEAWCYICSTIASGSLLALTVKSAGRRSETAQMQSVMRMVACKCPLQLQHTICTAKPLQQL